MSFNFKMPAKLTQATNHESLSATEQLLGKIPELKDQIKEEDSSIKSINEISGIKLKPIMSITNLVQKPKVKPVVMPIDSSIKSVVDISDEALSLMTNAEPSYKEALHEVVDLDALAREFQDEEQPDKFDDEATKAIHKAVIELEQSIDNAAEVKTQLTLIMNEIQKYPQTAARISDSDIHIMVKALRQSYNTVAFTKKINKNKSEVAKKKAIESCKDILTDDLFEGLGI